MNEDRPETQHSHSLELGSDDLAGTGGFEAYSALAASAIIPHPTHSMW